MNSYLPLVSVIIPAYNNETTIENACNSIIEQSYIKWECIIVDDGSKDNTLQIIKNYQLKDRRFKIFTQHNAGTSAARNYGLSVAKGEYIQFLDGDDYLDNMLLKTCVDTMLSNPKCDYIQYGINVYSEEGVLLRTPNPGNSVFNAGDGFDIFMPFYRLLNAVCSKFYRRSYITSLFRPVKGCEDLIFNTDNLNTKTNIIGIEKKFYNVQLHNDSANKKYFAGRLKDLLLCIKLLDNKLVEIFRNGFDRKEYVREQSIQLSLIIYKCCCNLSMASAVVELSVAKNSDSYAYKFLEESSDNSLKDKLLLVPFKHNQFQLVYLNSKILKIFRKYWINLRGMVYRK